MFCLQFLGPRGAERARDRRAFPWPPAERPAMIQLTQDGLHMLKKLPLFSALSAEDWEAVLQESVEKTIATGQVLFAEGDVSEAAYVVLSGSIEVYLDRDPPITLAELGRGMVVGEQALRPDGSG